MQGRRRSQQKRYRSARTGEYVSPEYAETHPDTTVKETDVVREKEEDQEDERAGAEEQQARHQRKERFAERLEQGDE